jgi:hypothetical protein
VLPEAGIKRRNCAGISARDAIRDTNCSVRGWPTFADFAKVGTKDSCRRRCGRDDHWSPLVNSYRARFLVSIASKAAPLPLLRFAHESTLHRIAMHVVQLLDALLRRPHIEIIEAMLPDMLASLVEQFLLCWHPALA